MVYNGALRVIHDSPLDGPVNMARDEALLMLVGDGLSPPTLRTYRWSPPTISLGYFQHYAEYERLSLPARQLPVVRRPTGGGAILHDQELTYSLTVPLDHPIASGRVDRLYELAHDALIECLGWRGVDAQRGAVSDGTGAARGPFFCFARRHPLDVLLGDAKVAGSAQRRTRSAVLQHGSIIFAVRFPQHPAGELRGFTAIGPEEFRYDFVRTLSHHLGLEAAESAWRRQELDVAKIMIPKYAGGDWTRRR